MAVRLRNPPPLGPPMRGMKSEQGVMAKIVKLHGDDFALPLADNSPEALKIFRAANERLRHVRWPAPYGATAHKLGAADARDLSSIPDRSVNLVVTSPPFWALKQEESSRGHLGDVEGCEEFLVELDKVWAKCARVLAPRRLRHMRHMRRGRRLHPPEAGQRPLRHAAPRRYGGAL